MNAILEKRLHGKQLIGLLAVFACIVAMSTTVMAEEKPPAGKSDGTFTVTDSESTLKLTAAERDLDAIKARGTLVVAMKCGRNDPYFYVGDNGQLIGFDVDLAKEIAKALGVKLEINRSFETFGSTAEAVAAGIADVAISNLTRTPKRQEIVDFTEPYVVGRLIVLMDLNKAGEAINGEIGGASDFNRPEIKIAFEEGSSYAEDMVEHFPKATGVKYLNQPGKGRLAAILNGDAHGLIQDNITMARDVADHPGILVKDGGRFTEVVVPRSEDPICIAMAKNTPNLMKAIKEVLEKMEVVEPSSLLKKYPAPKNN